MVEKSCQYKIGFLFMYVTCTLRSEKNVARMNLFGDQTHMVSDKMQKAQRKTGQRCCIIEGYSSVKEETLKHKHGHL